MTVADDLATLQDPKAPHAEALARVRAEIARLEREVRQQDVLIQRWMTEAEDKQAEIALRDRLLVDTMGALENAISANHGSAREIPEWIITPLLARFAALEEKAGAARGCAACDGDPEAHGLHVCGKEFGA